MLLCAIYGVMFTVEITARDDAATYNTYESASARVLAVVRVAVLFWFAWCAAAQRKLSSPAAHTGPEAQARRPSFPAPARSSRAPRAGARPRRRCVKRSFHQEDRPEVRRFYVSFGLLGAPPASAPLPPRGAPLPLPPLLAPSAPPCRPLLAGLAARVLALHLGAPLVVRASAWPQPDRRPPHLLIRPRPHAPGAGIPLWPGTG